MYSAISKIKSYDPLILKQGLTVNFIKYQEKQKQHRKFKKEEQHGIHKKQGLNLCFM
jgi:hypothetical protein